MKTLILKSDKYRNARGGYARFLDVYCEHCGHKVLVYQKDGPGELKRLYLDRVFQPEKFSRLQNLPIKKVGNLQCPNCRRVLGIPYIYPKEGRSAFRLFVGAIRRKFIQRSK